MITNSIDTVSGTALDLLAATVDSDNLPLLEGHLGHLHVGVVDVVGGKNWTSKTIKQQWRKLAMLTL